MRNDKNQINCNGEKFIISIGSNLPKETAEANVFDAIKYLQSFLDENLRFSSVYETAGVGNGEGKTYCNAVVKGETHLAVDEIVAALIDWEIKKGRTTEARRLGIVPIDLDLLVLGIEIFRPKDLAQKYVQQGLAEIISE